MAFYEGLSHLVLPVSDLAKSEKFYREVFGLDVVGRNLVAESQPNALLKTKCRQLLVLVETPEVATYRQNAMATHHAWLVDTVEEYKACAKKLEGLGYDISDYRASFRTPGQYSVDITDPDGHVFQIQTQGHEATDVRFEKMGVLNCGLVSDYELDDVKVFEKEKVVVVRLEEGFLALSSWCPHLNGVLRWRPQYFDFYCPAHGATFSQEGESTSHIKALPPLRLHPVTISAAGEIEVDTDRIVLRRRYDPEQVVAPVCGATLRVESLKNVKEMV